MIKVITYGTYDLLHYGHVRLLERAKELGDYLIVGVTADDFDKTRGKINVQQNLMERIEAVRATGIADEIIVEEYEGQKIDDIKKYDVDIFTVGSDWRGQFDYLGEYCKVIYLERTQGISSTDIRDNDCTIKLGLMGDSFFINKVFNETTYVNGIQVVALYTNREDVMNDELLKTEVVTSDYDVFLSKIDAVYVRTLPEEHYYDVKKALKNGKHVLCESPLTLEKKQARELFEIAQKNNLILMEAIKTAYSTAFSRLLLMIKGGKIGKVVSVDSTCTSLKNYDSRERTDWNGIYEWGPTALLPIFQILGTQYRDCRIIACFDDEEHKYDNFTKMEFVYDHAVASIKIGDGVKSEGELIVSGTQGYIYVPAPWWNTDYFEIRYENQNDNKRYFYQLEGEGIRYELLAFVRSIRNGRAVVNIDEDVTYKISEMMENYLDKKNMIII